jgi:hypothetical protein
MLGALMISSCCFGIGSECDPATYVPHCTATGYDWCWHDAMLGPLGGPAHIDHAQCESQDACIDLGSGHVGCAAGPPFVPCAYASFQARCDGPAPVTCYAPSNYISDPYELHRAACPEGQTCRVVGRASVCSP